MLYKYIARLDFSFVRCVVRFVLLVAFWSTLLLYMASCLCCLFDFPPLFSGLITCFCFFLFVPPWVVSGRLGGDEVMNIIHFIMRI